MGKLYQTWKNLELSDFGGICCQELQEAQQRKMQCLSSTRDGVTQFNSRTVFHEDSGEAIEQVTREGCGCPIPGDIQGQAGCGSGQPGLVVGDPAHNSQVATR